MTDVVDDDDPDLDFDDFSDPDFDDDDGGDDGGQLGADDEKEDEEADPEAKDDEAKPERRPAGKERSKPVATLEEMDKRWRDSTRMYKQTDRELRREREARAAREQRLASLEGLGGQQQREEEPPDPETDPIAYLAWSRKFVDSVRGERAEQARAEEAARAQQAQMQQLQRAHAEAEHDFAADHPDYFDAAKHFKQSLVDELQDMGLSGADLQRQLSANLTGVVARAMAAGRDPAEVVYNLAKRRGFGVDRSAKRLETVQRGQAASRSMSGAGGRQGSGGVDLKSVANLEGAAFDKAAAGLLDSLQRRRRA